MISQQQRSELLLCQSAHKQPFAKSKSVEGFCSSETVIEKTKSYESMGDLGGQSPHKIKKMFTKLFEKVVQEQPMDGTSDVLMRMCNQVAHGPAFYKHVIDLGVQTPLPHDEVLQIIHNLDSVEDRSTSHRYPQPNKLDEEIHKTTFAGESQMFDSQDRIVEQNARIWDEAAQQIPHLVLSNSGFINSLQSLRGCLFTGPETMGWGSCSGEEDSHIKCLEDIGLTGGFSKEVNCSGFDLPDLPTITPLATSYNTKDLAIEESLRSHAANHSANDTPTFQLTSRWDHAILDEHVLGGGEDLAFQDNDESHLLSARYPANKALRVRTALLPVEARFRRR